MKSVLKGIAILTHPIFLPFYSLFVYYPLIERYSNETYILSSVWLGFVYLFLPLVYFLRVRGINLEHPNLVQRKSIFRAYTLVNFGLAFVSLFLVHEYASFFIAATLLHVLMLVFSAIELKASWHTSVWSFLLGTALMVLYNYKLEGVGNTVLQWGQLLAALIVILSVVSWVRWKAKAHTFFELMMGIVAGLIASTPILFI